MTEQAAMAVIPTRQHSAAIGECRETPRPGSPDQLSVRRCHQRVSRVPSTKRDMWLARACAASRFSVRGVRVPLLVWVTGAVLL
jgi:hypothetical protein